PPGEGVLLAWMIAAQQTIGTDGRFGGVAEHRTRLGDVAEVGEHTQGAVPGEPAEADDHEHAAQKRQLGFEIVEAGIAFFGKRLVGRRSAADAGGDVAVREAQAVAFVDRRRLIGEAGAVERGVEEVAGAVAGEDAAGAVAAVRRGRQADDQHARLGIAEAGDRLAPVVLSAERTALDARDLFTPRDQPRTTAATYDLLVQHAEGAGGVHRVSNPHTFAALAPRIFARSAAVKNGMCRSMRASSCSRLGRAAWPRVAPGKPVPHSSRSGPYAS